MGGGGGGGGGSPEKSEVFRIDCDTDNNLCNILSFGKHVFPQRVNPFTPKYKNYLLPTFIKGNV